MQPLVSVIIPTYNRKDSLLRALDGLCQQTLRPDQYEVIVVDDGSTDATQTVANERYPFALKYLKQRNQGATKARNQGALYSDGNVLVFIDDDITISHQTLEALVQDCLADTRVVVLGRLIELSIRNSIFARINSKPLSDKHQTPGNGFVHFEECKTGLLAIRPHDFFELEMFQDPTDGWPNWDDVDFGYRAHAIGFRIRRSTRAVGEHWDNALADLATACRRWERASKSAVRLFQKYPEIQPHLPMFYDKTPIAWGQDPPRLIARKLARHVASSRPALWGLVRVVHILEQRWPSPALLRPLYRWVIGGYIFRGYREGLREQGQG